MTQTFAPWKNIGQFQWNLLAAVSCSLSLWWTGLPLVQKGKTKPLKCILSKTLDYLLLWFQQMKNFLKLFLLLKIIFLADVHQGRHIYTHSHTYIPFPALPPAWCFTVTVQLLAWLVFSMVMKRNPGRLTTLQLTMKVQLQSWSFQLFKHS